VEYDTRELVTIVTDSVDRGDVMAERDAMPGTVNL